MDAQLHAESDGVWIEGFRQKAKFIARDDCKF